MVVGFGIHTAGDSMEYVHKNILNDGDVDIVNGADRDWDESLHITTVYVYDVVIRTLLDLYNFNVCACWLWATVFLSFY
ncbi:Carboxypeptidase S1 A [Venturia inaequalis]|nr:Carboxypeptidase S1 A [Venturia inaequalis]